MIRTIFIPIFISVFFISFAYTNANDTKSPEFAPGQMWSIKSQSATAARVVVGRVEPWGDKIAVHISVINAPIPAGLPGAGGTMTFAHLPFEQGALAASVDRLEATSVSPAAQFENGYAQWRSAKGGIFTISVSDTIGNVFQTMGKKGH